jgi:uncharacterized OsmC-like protein
MAVINGVDIDKMKQTKQDIIRDSSLAERQPSVTAQWQGGSLAAIVAGDMTAQIGGDSNPTAMHMLLASLAACEVDLIAAHAALAGIKLDALAVEATGHFNRSAYYGIEDAPGSGYDRIDYVIRIKAPGITKQQINQLKEVCERFSPVGDSLSKAIPLKLDVKSD